MSTPIESRSWRLSDRVRVSGGEVAAGVFGAGPPVVLVHGTPAWSYLWRRVVPVLARAHTVHVWDLLGFGGSRIDPGVAPSIARQARTLAELVEHWGLDAPDLVGHDIGGGIVLRAHLVDEVPARRLALLDAAVIGPWNTPFTEHMQRHADAYRTMPTQVFADLISPRMRSATHREMSGAVAGAYLAPWTGPEGQQRWVDQVTSVRFDDTRDVVDRLDRITAPTLVLWGDHDEWLDPSIGDRLAAAIPGARRENVPDAGHFVAEDNPRDTADALLRFFA
ncbi:alpha/beta fold hydrolase [Amycolatopsis lurida]